MAYADMAFDRVRVNLFLKIDELADASAHLYLFAGIYNRNAGRVISPVFKTFQAVQKDVFCLIISYVANYSAHNIKQSNLWPNTVSKLPVQILTYVKEYAPVQTLVLPRIWNIFERELKKSPFLLVQFYKLTTKDKPCSFLSCDTKFKSAYIIIYH
jgi:hypothetical protein